MSIEEAYNSWAEQYDSNHNKTRDLDARSTKETLSRYPFKHVLELGCGTGKNTEWLRAVAETITALDFSDEMLSKAREKVTDSHVTFRKVNLKDDWDVENQSVDLITSSLTLEHIEDLNHIFQQAHLKLIENGLFFISELHPFRQYGGSGAKYESNGETIRVEVYTHHISAFVEYATKNGFQLLELKEWFDEDNGNKPPRLITFVFQKQVRT